MILGSLRHQLLYPTAAQDTAEPELRRVLELVNLPELVERCGGFDVELDFAKLLSVGRAATPSHCASSAQQAPLRGARLKPPAPSTPTTNKPCTSCCSTPTPLSSASRIARACPVPTRKVLEIGPDGTWQLKTSPALAQKTRNQPRVPVRTLATASEPGCDTIEVNGCSPLSLPTCIATSRLCRGLPEPRARAGSGALRLPGRLGGLRPDPAAVVDLVAALDGAVVVKGNHDEAIEVEPKVRDLNDAAYAAIVWTRQALSSGQRQFLSALPLLVKRDEACFVHASASLRKSGVRLGRRGGAAQACKRRARPTSSPDTSTIQVLYFNTPAGKTASFRPTPRQPDSGSTPPRLVGDRGLGWPAPRRQPGRRLRFVRRPCPSR